MNTSPTLSDLELAFGQALNLGFAEIFQGLLLALLLGVVVAGLYRVSIPGRVLSPAMIGSLVLLSVIGSMVMMVIGNNIARAFSLVGALSIIRFRTAVKDTRDTAFVFFALAAGMAAGTTRTMLVVSAFGGVGVFVLVLNRVKFGVNPDSTVLLTYSAVPDEVCQEASIGIIKKHGRVMTLTGLHTQRQGQLVEVSYLVELRRGTSPHRLVADLTELPGISRVVLSPGNHLAEP